MAITININLGQLRAPIIILLQLMFIYLLCDYLLGFSRKFLKVCSGSVLEEAKV